jgi:hypothetical protein
MQHLVIGRATKVESNKDAKQILPYCGSARYGHRRMYFPPKHGMTFGDRVYSLDLFPRATRFILKVDNSLYAPLGGVTGLSICFCVFFAE